MYRIILFVIAISCLTTCKQDRTKPSLLSIQKHEEFTPKSVVSQNIGRSSWQKPELVIKQLGELKGKKIADIGAGTGYFSYRLAYAGADVLALDVDPDMIALMDGFIANLPPEVGNRIETRLVKTDNPLLADAEIDAAIIINTISYINDMQAYLSVLNKGIRVGGKVLIVDYKNRTLDIPAPPMDQRVTIGAVQEALLEAGFTNIMVDDGSLEYQYIVSGEVR